MILIHAVRTNLETMHRRLQGELLGEYCSLELLALSLSSFGKRALTTLKCNALSDYSWL